MLIAGVCLLITSITFLHRGKYEQLCVLLGVAVCDLYIKGKKKRTAGRIIKILAKERM